jgi:hypothetical protein
MQKLTKARLQFSASSKSSSNLNIITSRQWLFRPEFPIFQGNTFWTSLWAALQFLSDFGNVTLK